MKNQFDIAQPSMHIYACIKYVYTDGWARSEWFFIFHFALLPVCVCVHVCVCVCVYQVCMYQVCVYAYIYACT